MLKNVEEICDYFNMMNARNWENYGQPYDVKSIMQYSGYAFSYKKDFKRLMLLLRYFKKFYDPKKVGNQRLSTGEPGNRSSSTKRFQRKTLFN